MPVIKLITKIDAPIAICFDLARSIDLHKLSTAGTQEEAIAGTTSGFIAMDDEVTWRAKHFGITQCLTSRITAYEYPFHFRDEMVRGPFKKIRHDHCFQQTGHVTLMKDVFEFESPAGIIGQIFNWLVLKRYLKELLVKRNRMIREVAESEQWKGILNA